MKKGAKKKVIKKNVERGKKILFFALRIFMSIIIGFLPSFIFITIFVQYGSIFANYAKFLLNFNSSWGAWASAIVLGFFAYFIIWIIKTRKNFKKLLKKRVFLIITLFCFLLILSLIIAQLYLYLNFISGNDVLIRLSADKNNIFFGEGLDEEVDIKISVIMNPFCSAQCEYELFDISTGQVVEQGNFNILNTILSELKSYTFDKDRLIQGQIMNRFEVKCKSKKTMLCYTKERESKRSVLITLNYELSGEEKEIRDNSKEQLIEIGEKVLSIGKMSNISNQNINSIGNLFEEDFSSELYDLARYFSESNQSFYNLKRFWEDQDFSSLVNQLNDSEIKVNTNYAISESLTSRITSNMSLYNNLVEKLEDSRELLLEVSQIELTNALCAELNLLIPKFNESIKQFKEELDLLNKVVIAENISYEVTNFNAKVQNIGASEVVLDCSLTQEISNEALDKANIVYFNRSEIVLNLDDPSSKCCYLGECEDCCENDCSEENYPIIFLHGHSINKALLVDYSFDSFSEIKEQLVDEGYIDAGAMIISSNEKEVGLWGKANIPIMVTASYFFDAYQEEDGIKIVSSNSDSLDTYAIRLRDIVNLIKYRTNKDKVILVAQSGGGLVARRYVQIFGADEVDKVILMTVPNHGVDEKTKGYCVLFGPEAACNDMDEKGIFINKLNSEATDDVSTYNIIGIGCDMGDETGDGIIKNSSQYLDYATNFYVEGVCNEPAFEFFHEYIVYPSQYVKAYEILKQILSI